MNSNTLSLHIEVDDNGSIKVRNFGKDIEETGKKGITAAGGMGVLKEDQVNIIVHGHEPILLEAMLISADILTRFEYTGIPQSQRRAVA